MLKTYLLVRWSPFSHRIDAIAFFTRRFFLASLSSLSCATISFLLSFVVAKITHIRHRHRMRHERQIDHTFLIDLLADFFSSGVSVSHEAAAAAA